MPETSIRPGARLVGYALNVFPTETLDDLWRCLEGDVLEIKRRAFPGEPFPIELRFSERIVRELQQDCDRVARLKYFLDVNDLALVTINGFVMPHFHGERVKERVYLPAWHESEARLQFTNACCDLLAQLTPPDAELLSVSVPFGALKPVTMSAVAPNILKAGEHAARSNIIVALEPEPGLCVETTDEVVEFFNAYVPQALRNHLAVNFDFSHQLVEFEDLHESIRRLQDAGILIAKIHVSNAAELRELVPFYADSIYLHQVCGVDAAGRRQFFSLDWPAKAPPAGIVRYRVHYHLPVFPTALPSTLPAVERFLTHLPFFHPSTPFIIETYTWPEQLRGRDRLVDNICRELAWVREKISLSRP
jgi:sugar phosphate isomerase/epimerase